MVDINLLPIEGAGKDELQTLYNWSFEAANSAQKIWEREKPCNNYVSGPLYRWRAAQELLEIGKHYLESKDKRAILEALYLCSLRDLPIPMWCKFAFLERFYRGARQHEFTSWDEAFGRPIPKGGQLAPRREKYLMGPRVYSRVRELHNQGMALDGYLFEKVGREFGFGSKTKTEETYYKMRDKMENAIK